MRLVHSEAAPALQRARPRWPLPWDSRSVLITETAHVQDDLREGPGRGVTCLRGQTQAALYCTFRTAPGAWPAQAGVCTPRHRAPAPPELCLIPHRGLAWAPGWLRKPLQRPACPGGLVDTAAPPARAWLLRHSPDPEPHLTPGPKAQKTRTGKQAVPGPWLWWPLPSQLPHWMGAGLECPEHPENLK